MGLMVAATLALVSCEKEKNLDIPSSGENVEAGVRFTLNLNPVTRTVIDDATLSTTWASGDRVNVFHAVSGTTNYVDDGAFSFTSGSTFEGTLASALDASENYDWYVCYPYSDATTSPSAMAMTVPGDQYQSASGSMAHICGNLDPLAGKVTGVAASATPTLNLDHLLTVVKITATNYESSAMNLELISFLVKPDNNNVYGEIAGQFTVDFTGSAPVYTCTHPSYRPLLHLNTPINLGLNDDAVGYMALAPFKINNAGSMTMGMNNNSGGITRAIYGKNVSCKAGKIYKIHMGSRMSPPFKDGINFYHGRKKADGTYTIDNDGWWRCDLPADFQLAGEFNFADLFTSVNIGDASVSIIGQGDQGPFGQTFFNDLSACIYNNGTANPFAWKRNARWTTNFPDSWGNDKGGVFLNVYVGYRVAGGAFTIWFRIQDPFRSHIAVDNGMYKMRCDEIDGKYIPGWENEYDPHSFVYGHLTAGEHDIDLVPFINAEPVAWGDLSTFYSNWKSLNYAPDGIPLITNTGSAIALTEYAAKYCQFSRGIYWDGRWFTRHNGSGYEADIVDGNATVLSNYGIQITENGHLVTTSAYDGCGFRFAPCLRFEYDYGFSESPASGNYTLVNFGPRYLPYIVCNI